MSVPMRGGRRGAVIQRERGGPAHGPPRRCGGSRDTGVQLPRPPTTTQYVEPSAGDPNLLPGRGADSGAVHTQYGLARRPRSWAQETSLGATPGAPEDMMSSYILPEAQGGYAGRIQVWQTSGTSRCRADSGRTRRSLSGMTTRAFWPSTCLPARTGAWRAYTASPRPTSALTWDGMRNG